MSGVKLNNHHQEHPVQRVCSAEHINEADELRKKAHFSLRRFDVNTLPADVLRVYHKLEERFDEEYALLFVFIMQTAMEMHRAWNITLLTSKVLKECADTVGLRMTWDLGVIRLRFFIEDGDYELQRKCPYDYDSEFQDMFMRIATALYHGHLTVHEALIIQDETKKGLHTAKSGLVFRTYPGRLILVAAMSATCAVIFFGGTWKDAGVAAICGLVSGLFDYGMSTIGGEAGVLTDLFVGSFTGIIGSLFYRFGGEQYCLSSIFLGTMYWFFYGTAFVVGLVEILAGELETGVTRFMAVCIKTFVLCVMACFGMLLVLEKPAEAWVDQAQNCGTIDLGEHWWRIPLYLACSVSVLGQYRFRFQEYWRGLVVMLVAYEVQWQVTQFFVARHASSKDNLDVMASNIAGAGSSVVVACLLSYIMDQLNAVYYGRILQRGRTRENDSKLDNFLYSFMSSMVKLFNCIGCGRTTDKEEVALEAKIHEQTKEIQDQQHSRQELTLEPHEEALFLDTIVFAESMNIWAYLMPAIYQLVPGSMIAKFWFESLIPPPIESGGDNMFAGLMVTSISLALGIIIGDAVVTTSVIVFRSIGLRNAEQKIVKTLKRSKSELRNPKKNESEFSI